jgi:hypothetical protein
MPTISVWYSLCYINEVQESILAKDELWIKKNTMSCSLPMVR